MTKQKIDYGQPIELVSGYASPESILCGAVDVIREHGWTQRTLGDEAGAVCLIGALNVVVWGVPDLTDGGGSYGFRRRLGDSGYQARWELFEAAQGKVVEVLGTWFIPDWNDDPGRTVEEVIQALQTAGECDEEDMSSGTGPDRYPPILRDAHGNAVDVG